MAWGIRAIAAVLRKRAPRRDQPTEATIHVRVSSERVIYLTPRRRPRSLHIEPAGFASRPMEHPLRAAARHKAHHERVLNRLYWRAQLLVIEEISAGYLASGAQRHLLDGRLSDYASGPAVHDGTYDWLAKSPSPAPWPDPARSAMWLQRQLEPINMVVNDLEDA